MTSRDSRQAAWQLLGPRLPRLLSAIALGACSLGSALALAGAFAWPITRAWQMPPVLDLSVAVVAVRAFGISRGVLGYCERLVSHDVALRSAGHARSEIYRSLARGPLDAGSRLRGGELLARVGSDVDVLSDVLARALVPIGVALTVGIAAISVIAMISGAAATLLAVCLLFAGVVAPWLAARAARAQESVATRLRSRRDSAAVVALDHAAELRVAGRLSSVIADAEREHRDWGRGMDRAGIPAAAAVAAPAAATAVSVLGAVIIGIGLSATTTPTALAVLMLLPLAAFEATAALPAAAIALVRGRLAARRLVDLAPTHAGSPDQAPQGVRPAITAQLRTPRQRTPRQRTPRPRAPRLQASGLQSGHAGANAGQLIDLDLAPGDRFAITGESGAGKTSLLMTLAGLIPPVSGSATLDGRPVNSMPESELRSYVCYFAEDAHLFTATVRGNLLVANGDCSDRQLADVLQRVGLRGWLDGLPDGLATVLEGGAAAVSAGQRRRLLLARVLVCPAPIVLLDEPTEHLDFRDAVALLDDLLDPLSGLLEPTRTVVVATHQLPAGRYPDCQLSIHA